MPESIAARSTDCIIHAPQIYKIVCNVDESFDGRTHSTALNQAIKMIALQGGGELHLAAGSYILDRPLQLLSGVRIVGAGSGEESIKTVLIRPDVIASALLEDADIGEKQFRPHDPSLFHVGMGIMFQDQNKINTMATMPLWIVDIQDGICYLNDYIIHDWRVEDGARAVNYYPLVHAMEQHSVAVSHLTIDCACEDSLAEGIWGACLYLRRCRNVCIEGVDAMNCRGDGLRFGQSRDLHIHHCRALNNFEYGIHPGSHTKLVTLTDCEISGNGSDGLYICWGIQNSLFARNHIHHNGAIRFRSGLCIGHKDTDNIIEDNNIHDNSKHGIHIRIKTVANGAHRNIFRRNKVYNNGVAPGEISQERIDAVGLHELEGCGVYINGCTHDLVFEGNEITNESGSFQKRGIFIAADTERITMIENNIHGHEIDFENLGA